MKKNNKGFTLVETLIASTLVVSVLVFLLVQFTKLNRNYEYSFSFNTVQGIYSAKELNKYVTENNITCTPTDVPCELNNIDNTFMEKLNIKKIYIINDNGSYSDIENTICTDNITNKCKKFASINWKTNKNNKKRLLILYNDDTYTTILAN